MCRRIGIFRFFIVLLLIGALGPLAYADRTQLEPGLNLFSPEQDVEMGREVAQQAERELDIMDNRQAQAYIDRLGGRLASVAPGEDFPYQFRLVNDTTINAFALPGGFVFINRGTVEAAETEAQLAGVVAHEIAHVALRHGTSQVSRAYPIQLGAQVLGGVFGGGSIGGLITELGIGFAANSILLSYSRDAEREADLMAAQILFDSGFNPDGVVEFFQTLEAKDESRTIEFFSSHPSPDNRIEGVREEIVRLGGAPPRARADSTEFQQVRRTLAGLPAPAERRQSNAQAGPPPAPSSRFMEADFGVFTLSHPDNWGVYGDEISITIAPDQGIVSRELAYGFVVGEFRPEASGDLEQATDELVDVLRQSNPEMRITRRASRTSVDGERALSTVMDNRSPTGSEETDWLVTVLHPNGMLYYFIGVAPEEDFDDYERTFRRMIGSVRFR